MYVEGMPCNIGISQCSMLLILLLRTKRLTILQGLRFLFIIPSVVSPVNVIHGHTITIPFSRSSHESTNINNLSPEDGHRRQVDMETHEDTAGNTLLLTQILFRHGDRSPISSYPTDPHKYDWPQGLGQLTQIGMMQAYQLGLYLQHRYQDFLSQNYKHEEVYIRSTNFDRTLMTAQCVAAGLFPFSTSGQDDVSLSWPVGTWQPIPIQTVPGEEDALLHPTHSCDYIQNLEKGLFISHATKQSMINKKELMFTLSRNTGMDINVTSLYHLSDTVFCQLQHNMSQPEWMTPDIVNQLLDYREYRPAMAAEEAKYLSGMLLNTMMQNMFQKVHNNSDQHKIYLYSAHDSTVSPLMDLLQVSDQLQVPYTAAFIMELHLIDQQPFVKLFYRNDTAVPPFSLVAKRCGVSPCPLNVFHVMHRDCLLTDDGWGDVCPKLSAGERGTNDNTIPLMVAALVALIGLNVFLGFKAYSIKQQVREVPGQQQYSLLQSGYESSDSEIEMTAMNGVEDRSSTNGGITLDLGAAGDAERREDELDDSSERESI